VDNEGEVSGGAIRCKNSSPTISNCTFIDNKAPVGATAFCIATSSPVFENCIIAYSQTGEAIRANDAGSEPTLVCCDVYSNQGGNWLTIEELENLNGNFSLEPLFCDLGEGNLALRQSSPCTPGNNACGVLIGALSADCGPVAP
jgi:hypothetical protein